MSLPPRSRGGRGPRRGYAARSRPAVPKGRSLVGTVVELEVGPVAHGGHCVARHEGRVVFVRHTLPGERVRAVVTEGTEGDRFLRADTVEVLVAAPERVPPPCRYAGECGGCDWQHVDLAHQRTLKATVVQEQLRRLAGIDRPVVVEPVAGDRDGLGWRTRVEFAVGPDGRPGLRRHRSHEVLPVEACPIADPRVIATGVLGREWSGHRAVDVVASSTGETAVVPVPPGDGPVLTELVTRPGGDIADGSVGGSVGSVAGSVGGPVWSWSFRVAARGFWQVHPGAAATFVAAVLDGLGPRPGERVLDLYAGVGLFARALADRVGPQGSVVAIEADPQAAGFAGDNAAGCPWVEVRTGRLEEHVPALPASDLVVLDPPRSGAGLAVVEAICALRPRAIAYVACDPAALARDLAYAASAGYALTGLTAYDAFPMTHHVECVAILGARVAEVDTVVTGSL